MPSIESVIKTDRAVSSQSSADAKLNAAISKMSAGSAMQKDAANKLKQQRSNVTAARKILASSTATDEQKKRAQDIIDPPKQNLLRRSLGSIAGSPAGKLAMGLVDLADTPRAAVVASLSEGTDLLMDAFNMAGNERVDFSLRELVKDTRDNKGFGSVLREKQAAVVADDPTNKSQNKMFGIKIFENPEAAASAPKGSKAFREWLASEEGGKKLDYTTGGKAANITAGITGDIGLDPLTYVTMGGSQFAGMSADAVASTAIKAGRDDIAQKAATKGKWALNAKDLKDIGLAGEGGIHFRVPGTGAIGRKTINRQLDGPITTAAIRGTENAMRFTPIGGYQSIRAWGRGGITDKGIAKMLGGKYSDLRDWFVKGTPEQFKQAFETLQADRIAIGREKTFADQAMRQYSSYEAKIKKLRLNPEDVYNALGDTEDATAAFQRIASTPEGLEFITDFRNWAQDSLPKFFNEQAGREVVANLRQGWQPSLRPKETRDFLIETYGEKGASFTKGGPLGKSAFETKANIVVGGEFLGETLVSEKEAIIKYGEALNAREQAHKILEQRAAAIGMDQVYAMFETDITKAMPAAIRNMSRRVYTSQMELELLNRGVAQSLNKVVQDDWLMAAEGALAQAKRHIQDLRMDQRVAKASLNDQRTLLARIEQRARVLSNVAEGRNIRRNKVTREVMRQANAAAAADLKLANEAAQAAARYTADLPALRAETTKLLKGIDNLAYLRTPEYTAAKGAVKAARLDVDKTYATMGRLARLRQDVGAKLAKVEAELDSSAKKSAAKIAQRDELARQMAGLEDQLVDLQALHATTIDQQLIDDISIATERLDQIKQARNLTEELQAVLATGDTARTGELAALESQLANNFWTDMNGAPDEVLPLLDDLERELTNSLGDLKRQMDLAEPLRSEIDRTTEQLAMLSAQAQRAGRTDLMGEVLLLQRSLPRSEAAALINPSNADGLWYLGDFGRVSASSARGFRGSAEGLEGAVGLRLTQEAGEQTGEVVLKVTRPKFYGNNDVLDLAYEHRQFAAYGTKAPTPVRVLRNDMLRNAVQDGAIRPSMVPDNLRPAWKQMEQLIAAGHSVDEAVNQSFGNALGLTARTYDVAAVDDSEWLLSQLADRLIGDGGTLSADLKDKIATSFRERLGTTHDAIVLPNGKGGWQVMVTDPSALYDTGGKPVKGISAMWDAYNTQRAEVYKKADLLRKQFDEVGTDLDLAHANFQHLERNLIDSRARLTELESTLGDKVLTDLQSWDDIERFTRSEAERFGTAAAQHRKNAMRFYQDALKVTDQMQRSAALEQLEIEQLLAQQADIAAAARVVEADMARRSKELGRRTKKLNKFEGKVADRLEQNFQMTGDPMKRKVREVLDDSMKFQVRMLSQDSYAPNFIVQAINDMTRVIGAPNGSEGLLRGFDKVTNLWKAQAITRPGFHIRNYMGGALNNWIGNVESSAYSQFTQRFSVYRKAVKAGMSHEEALIKVGADFSDLDALKLRQIIEAGVVTGGQAAETSMLSHAHATNWNPFSTSFKGYELNSRGMVHIENHLRGTMAWDRLNKGLDVDAILSDVARYHFDYDDLSHFERSFVRRVVPFYTWTRKNLPLQIEMLLENPKQIQRFMNIKNEIEMVSQEEDVTPDWFGDNMTIRLPFKVGGDQAYTFVDMPFRDMATAFSPRKGLETMNPFLKVPLERSSGQKFFGNIPFQEGYQPVPSIWTDIGIPQVLAGFGKAEKDANGNWVMRDKDLYTVEQWVPFLAQSRRMGSDEERYAKRRVYTWATFFTGQTVRVNTQKDQNSELIRRSKELQSYSKDLETLGYYEKPKR